MPIVVQKYGGTSVGDTDRISAIADRIVRAREQGQDVVVVVSAMGRTTDDLLEKASDITITPEPRELLEAGLPEWRVAEVKELFRPVGCSACGNTGYRGRMGLYEVMPVSEEIERLTVERASSDQIRAVAIEQGMFTLRNDGLEKAVRGLTSLQEIARVVK